MKRVLLLLFLYLNLLSVSVGAHGEEEARPALAVKSSISYTAALKIAQRALQAGAEQGTDLAVAVVDREGIPLVVLRADNATEQFVTGATRKAWTAVNLRNSTRSLLKDIQENKQDDGQLPHVEKALFLMGGVPLMVGNTIVGGVGVAGSVNGLDDDACARQAAQAFAELLNDREGK
ncbi:hypothetical protein Mal52_30550 [Symmachiella dynata]|uniref:Heme-binding protein n=1 Tax=Symmachiella dynata TaxID=2527995 RepID=A0A517ZQ22_9PLAN|nr:heme-binding protein [Symmachiella dynata]QDU44571.1 hypothetical protein Mal52_30550 [Symmachiella dynata]